MADLSESYLYAIQHIKGETRAEKLKEISRIVQRVVEAGTDERGVEELSDIPQVKDVLMPLIQVLVAVKLKLPSIVVKALKSDNIHLINEALRAQWLYDGSTSITNYHYFSKEIFPYVSRCTRRKIFKRLSGFLGGKNPALAEEFFNGIAYLYGAREGLIFLPACSERFVYEVVVIKYTIKLPSKILKLLYSKHPNFVVQYLSFADYDKQKSAIEQTMCEVIDFHEYKKFMPLLITKHPELYIKLQSIHRISPRLGKRRTMMLLKQAKQLFIENPRYIIDYMPIKLVHENLSQNEFETMFGNIMREERWETFEIDTMFLYLGYYPQEKIASLIINKVKEIYGYDLLEKSEKFTGKFLLLLPDQIRHDLARQLIQVRRRMDDEVDPEECLWCHLPTSEGIAAIKKQISQSWGLKRRRKLFSLFIDLCRLNQDKAALLEVLEHVDQDYPNESSKVICNFIDRIYQECELDSFDNRYWTILIRMIKRLKLDKRQAREYWMITKILKRYVHYCLNNNLPADDIIELIVQLFMEGRVGVSWDLLMDEREYEKKYLEACFSNAQWDDISHKTNIVDAIYSFNERHKLTDNPTERLSLKNYPGWLEIVERAMKDENRQYASWMTYSKEKLKMHEPELYRAWFPNEENEMYAFIATGGISEGKEEAEVEVQNGEEIKKEKNVVEANEENMEEDSFHPHEAMETSFIKEKPIFLTEAMIALRKNYKVIKNNWLGYYEYCRKQVEVKTRQRVARFLRALQWYQDVPIKFVEKAMEDDEFDFLAYLLDGPTYCKIAQIKFAAEVNNCSRYLISIPIVKAIRNTSTPISLDLVEYYLTTNDMYRFKNYRNNALSLWLYVAHRTAPEKMIMFSKRLAGHGIFLKKHAIREIHNIAATPDVINFYKVTWLTEKHPFFRQLLAQWIRKLFRYRPTPDSWDLMRRCIATCEEGVIGALIGFPHPVQNEYTAEYIEQMFKQVQKLVSGGMRHIDALELLNKLLAHVGSRFTDRLSEQFYTDLITYYRNHLNEETPSIDTFIVRVYLTAESEHLEERFSFFYDCFMDDSKRWYTYKVEKRQPHMSLVYRVTQAATYEVTRRRGNSNVIERFDVMFTSNLKSYQYSKCVVMMFYCREYLQALQSSRQFGIRISQNIDSLVAQFSPEYFMLFVDSMREFIIGFIYFDHSATMEMRYEFLQGLIKEKRHHGLLMATKLVQLKLIHEDDHRYHQILKQLGEIDNPLVQSLL